MDNAIGFSDKFTAAALLAQTTKDIVILGPEDYAKAGATIANIRDLEKDLEAEYKAHPVIVQAKELQKQKAELAMLLENARKTAKGYMIAWDEEQDRKRQAEEVRLAAEAKAAAEAEALNAAIEAEKAGAHAEAETILETPVIVPVVVLPKQTPKVAGHTVRTVKKWKLFAASGTYTKDTWKPSTRIAAAEVPKLGPSFLAVNPAALNARADSMGKAGSIPGVFEIWEEKV